MRLIALFYMRQCEIHVLTKIYLRRVYGRLNAFMKNCQIYANFLCLK